MIPLTPYFSWGLFKELSPAEKAVLVLLCHKANKNSRCAWPSHELIAQDTGITERSVRTALHGLENRGLIEIRKNGVLGDSPQKKATGKGGGKFTYYMKDIDHE